MNEEKTIEIMKDFEAEGITTDPSKKRHSLLLDFQDCIGHSTMNDIFDFYQKLDQPARRIFLWSCCTCLDKDTFLEIVKKVVCQHVIIAEEQRLAEAYQQKLDTVATKNQEVQKKLDYLAKKQEKHEWTEKELERVNQEKARLRDFAAEQKEKADNFDTIKTLLR